VTPLRDIATRLRVVGRHDKLDRMLADGHPPEESSALALRARELTSKRSRDELAGSVLDAVEAAEHPVRGPFRPNLAVDISAVLAVKSDLVKIAERLRDNAPVNPRGVAIVSCLLRDGESPLYLAPEPVHGPEPTGPGLRTRVEAALDTLDL
jgi:hypothetical protein